MLRFFNHSKMKLIASPFHSLSLSQWLPISSLDVQNKVPPAPFFLIGHSSEDCKGSPRAMFMEIIPE